MTMTTRSQPFSRVDTAWLRMEDPTNLMMASGMMLFPHRLPLQDLRRVLEERLLDAFPRFRMRAVDSPLGIGSPTWELDHHFDLDSHLHHVALPAPGGQKELEALVSDIVSTPLDFTKPPWQLHLVDGFEGGSALVTRVHHCIADGMALMQVLWSLTDDVPGPGTADGRAHHDGIHRATRGSTVLRAAGTLLHPRQVGDVAAAVLSGTRATLGLTVAAPDTRTVLKGDLGVAKRTAWTDRHSLPEIKRIARAHGATLNDVLTTAVAGGLGTYLRGRRVDVGTAVVRAAVPVNLRDAGPATTLGNDFGLVYLELPLDIASPTARIAEVRRRMTALKKSHLAEASLLVLGAFGTLPAWLQPMAVNFFGLKASLTLTNVPGPRSARYLAGHRVGDVLFWGPTSGRLSLGISVLSYAGHVRIGVISDAGLVPDPERITELVEAELGRLRSEMDGAPRGRRAPSPARRAAAAG